MASVRIASTALVLYLALLASGCASEPPFHGEAVSAKPFAAEIEGTNWNGESVRLSDLRGQVVVLFFGYTSCPDICPMALSKMKQVRRQLEERAADVAVVFVSVDPDRDSVERLAGYVPGFDRGFYGLHVALDGLRSLHEDYGVEVTIRRPSTQSGFYTVDHTSAFFLIDRDGRLRVEEPGNAGAEQIAEDLLRLIDAPQHRAWRIDDTGTAGAFAAAAPAPGRLTVEGATARIVPGAPSGAVYLRVVNPGGSSDRLLSASTAVAALVETHESVEDGGVARMVPHPDGFEIPPGQTLELAPGGKHLMLMGLHGRSDNETIALTLVFERAGEISVEARVVAFDG